MKKYIDLDDCRFYPAARRTIRLEFFEPNNSRKIAVSLPIPQHVFRLIHQQLVVFFLRGDDIVSPPFPNIIEGHTCLGHGNTPISLDEAIAQFWQRVFRDAVFQHRYQWPGTRQTNRAFVGKIETINDAVQAYQRWSETENIDKFLKSIPHCNELKLIIPQLSRYRREYQ